MTIMNKSIGETLSSLDIEDLTKARSEGYVAYFNKLDLFDDNPYQRTSEYPMMYAWAYGWMVASREPPQFKPKGE